MKKIVLGIIACLAVLEGALAQQGEEKQFLSNVRRLTLEGKRAGEGYFSGDGKQIVFQSEREAGNPFYQIYTLNLENGETRRVSPGTGKTTCAFFNPKGDRIMFASTHLDPNSVKFQQAELDFRASGKKRRYSWDYDSLMDIYSCNPDGGNMKRLTSAMGYDAEGAYSPDGKYIVFSSLRGAYEGKLSNDMLKKRSIDPAYFGEVYIMNADGSNQKRLTNWPGYDGGTFFSPDGKRIIFRHFDEKGEIADVYSMKLDGSDLKRMTDFKSMSWAPYYHPSGKYIIFTSNKLGFDNFELYISDVEGKKEPVRVSYTSGFDGLPVFSPNGLQLCWSTNRSNDGSTQLYMGKWNHEAALKALEQAGSVEKQKTITSEIKSSVSAPTLKLENMKKDLNWLASNELKGRRTGSAESAKVAEYLDDELRKLGYASTSSTMKSGFTFIRSIKLKQGENYLRVYNKKGKEVFGLKNGKYAMPYSFSENDRVTGSLVFTGFGLNVQGMHKYESAKFAGGDLFGKIAVCLEGIPGGQDKMVKDWLASASKPYNKAKAAVTSSAKMLIIVSKDSVVSNNDSLALGDQHQRSSANISTLKISFNQFEKLCEAMGWKQTATLAKQYMAESNKESFEVADSLLIKSALKESKNSAAASVQLSYDLVQEYNVVGLLMPEGPRDAKDTLRFVTIGAHYDHLGLGEYSSLADSKDKHDVHNGADDNASGVAMVLELARYFAADFKQRPERYKSGLAVGFWSGEELGLLGSAEWIKNPGIPKKSMKAHINFDMVGRLSDNKLTIQGTGSSNIWPKLAEKHNIRAGFELNPVADPFAPSDGTTFYNAGIPALNVFTGVHSDYHKPSDDTDKINFEGMQRIAEFSAGMIAELLADTKKPDYLKVEQKAIPSRSGTIYLGTIPDYAADVKGLKLSGVREGGPASKAGIQANDIIIKLADKTVNNIYDYMYLMDGLSPEKPVGVTVLREGKEVNLTITPTTK